MRKGDKWKKVLGVIVILAIIVSVFGGVVSAEDVSGGLKQSVDDEEIQTEVGNLGAQACGDMGVNPASWSPTIDCDESDNEIVIVSASSGIVNGVTVSKISGPTWLSVSPTNLGDIASGSSKTFTMIASPPFLGTCGDFGYTVRVSNTCGSPSTTDVSGTIHLDCSAPNQPPSYSNPSVSPSSATLSTPPFGGWLVLDGLDDYAEAEDHFELDVGDQIGESMTVEAWVNFETFRTAEIIRKLGAYGLSTDAWSMHDPTNPSTIYRYRCLIFWLCNNELRCCHTQFGGGFHIPGWHHVAGVFDEGAGVARVYMDGEQISSNASLGQALVENTTDPLRIGESVPGMVDEVRISDVARYTGSTYPVPTSPFTCDEHTRALWHFDEFEGATVFHDASGMVDNLLVGYNGAHTEGVQGQACEGSDTSCGIYPDCENCDEKDGCYEYGNGCEERNYYCVSNEEGCDYTYSNRHTDGWVDTGNTQWVEVNECKEKEQKEQEYRDYACSGGACIYSETGTQWVDTGNTQNKDDGTVCGCTASNTLKRCYGGVCTDTGICDSTTCGADAACDGKEPGDSCGGGICDSNCKCGGTPMDDIAITRDYEGMLVWHVDTDRDGSTDLIFSYGAAGDRAVVGDINNDGIDDIAITRDYGGMLVWHVDTDRDGSTDLIFSYGAAGDRAVVGDINNDGIDDIAITRDYGGMLVWHVDTDRDGSTDLIFSYGAAGDRAVVGDINNDGIDDIAITRDYGGMLVWHVDTDRAGLTDLIFSYGAAGDRAVVGDIG